eukprot:6157306-Amphidinium_carterae.1
MLHLRKQGHTSTTCYYTPKGKHGKGQSKGTHNNRTINNKGKDIHNNSHPINSNTTVNHHHSHHITTKATAKAMESNGTVVTTKVGRKDTPGFNRSTTITTPTATMTRTQPPWDYSYNQEWFPEADYPQQLAGQEVDQQQ